MTAVRRTRVFLVCPGLGHINRGFETFTRECFDALQGEGRLDPYLFKGAGPTADRERAVWCLRRDQAAAHLLGVTFHRDPYYVEQTTFTFSLLTHLVRFQPDVVYFSDGVVGNMLWRWRRLTRSRYKLLLSNGGPLGPPGFPRFDHVHQVLETCYDESARAGRPAGTQTLLPYGFDIGSGFAPRGRPERMALRVRLRLPENRPVVLTVGAVNCSHKRMDYVVREVASLPAPRPFLVMLGQREAETLAVLALAEELLGPAGYLSRTVPAAEVRDYYDAADVFVLASLNEGFGRVLAEALARGLPCLTADRPFARQVLGEHGRFADLTRSGELAGLITQVLAEGNEPAQAAARHASVCNRLSWDRLGERYVDMIERCARGPELNRYGPMPQVLKRMHCIMKNGSSD